MYRKKFAVLAAMIAVLTMLACGGCAPNSLTTDQKSNGEYMLKSFTVRVGTAETKLAPDAAEAQKYASLLALYGKTFTAKDGVMTFTGSAFPKDTAEEFTVSGEQVEFESKTLNKMFKTFTIKDGIATVEINGNGLSLTLSYENQTKQQEQPPAQGGEPSGEQQTT